MLLQVMEVAEGRKDDSSVLMSGPNYSLARDDGQG